MNDTLEQSLRDLFRDDAAAFDAGAAVQRLRACPARSQSKRRFLWPAVGMGSTALTAGVVAAILLLSSGAPAAYAGWAAIPAAASRRSQAETGRTCAHAFTGSGAATDERAFTHRPVLAETRGIYTALVVELDGRIYSCMTSGDPGNSSSAFDLGISQYGPAQTPPPGDLISAPYSDQGGVGEGRGENRWTLAQLLHPRRQAQIFEFRERVRGGGYGPSALGQAGSEVSAVSFTFANGETVAATVENGWYFAWWPWLSKPTTVTVSNNSGTATSPVSGPRSFQQYVVPQCRPGSHGCVFAAAQPAPTTTSAAGSDASSSSPTGVGSLIRH